MQNRRGILLETITLNGDHMDNVNDVLTIFDEQGFTKLLAIAGYLFPYVLLWGVYKLARYFIDKCGATLKSIDDKLGE